MPAIAEEEPADSQEQAMEQDATEEQAEEEEPILQPSSKLSWMQQPAAQQPP